MAGRKTIETNIKLGGEVDSSFSSLTGAVEGFGQSLSALGSEMKEFGSSILDPIVDYGKEAVRAYAAFDDNMRAIQGKLGDVSAAEMEALSEQAREWAKTTRYHASDVAAALKEAATSGWTLEQMYSGLPVVMNMAAGASIQLEDAMDMMSTALAGMNLGFEDAQELVDMWLKTANNSRATVTDIGDSFQRLGSLATLGDSKEEILTLLGVFAQFGTRGSEAGTLLRNVIMRLIAPTTKAAKAMGELGLTEEDMGEGEVNLADAAKALQEIGFSAFDAQGNMKPLIQIVSELRKSLKGMTEKQMLDVLARIFPQRSIRGIMDLLRATDEDYEALMNTITDSTGYAAEVAQLQEGGLGGTFRRIESQWEEIQLMFGESIEPQVSKVAEAISGMLNDITEMPKEQFDALVGAISGVAASAGGLVLVGSALGIIGKLLSPAGLLMTGIVGLGAFAGMLHGLENVSLTETFGTMETDLTAFSATLTEKTKAWTDAYAEIDKYRTAVNKAMGSYRVASMTLSSNLLSAMLTQSTLSEADIAHLEGLGEQMASAAIEGVAAKMNESAAYLELLFGGEEGLDATDTELAGLLGILNTSYAKITETIQKAGQEARDALTAAWADGQISGEEYQNIIKTFQSYNEAVAVGTAMARNREAALALNRAQNASWDTIKQIFTETGEQRATALAKEDEEYIQQRADLEFLWNMGKEQGWTWDNPQTEEVEHIPFSALNFDTYAQELEQRHFVQHDKIAQDYDRIPLEAAEAFMASSGLGKEWAEMMEYAARYNQGGISRTEANATMRNRFGASTLAGDSVLEDTDGSSARHQMGVISAYLLNSLGGYQEVAARAARLEAAGQTEQAAQYRQLLTMQDLMTNWGTVNFGHGEGVVGGVLEQILGDLWVERPTQEVIANPFANPYYAGLFAQQGYRSRHSTAFFDPGGEFWQEVGKGNTAAFRPLWAGMNANARDYLTEQLQARGYSTDNMTEVMAGLSDMQQELEAGLSHAVQFPQDGGGHHFGEPAPPPAETVETAAQVQSLLELLPKETQPGQASPAQSVQESAGELSQAAQSLSDWSKTLGGSQTLSAVPQEFWQTVSTGDTEAIRKAWGSLSDEAIDAIYSTMDQLEGVDFDLGHLAQQGYSPEFGDLQKLNELLEESGVLSEPVEIPVKWPEGATDANSYLKAANAALSASPVRARTNVPDGYSDGTQYATDFQTALNDNPLKTTIKNGENGEGGGLDEFAEGGRATTASIFGEAGAEWAIPEEHSERTAELLLSAAQASGFTWGELLSRTGGLNASANSDGGTFVYSPTYQINGGDTEALREELEKERVRMKKWWTEQQMLGARASY